MGWNQTLRLFDINESNKPLSRYHTLSSYHSIVICRYLISIHFSYVACFLNVHAYIYIYCTCIFLLQWYNSFHSSSHLFRKKSFFYDKNLEFFPHRGNEERKLILIKLTNRTMRKMKLQFIVKESLSLIN